MIVEPAQAKLNLALHVRSKRDDGYHELETIFAFAQFGDKVSIEVAAEDAFAITGPFGNALDSAADNLVIRARDDFRAAFGMGGPVAIELAKHLPVASGIGGGSADAAATLRGLARLFEIDADDPRLMDCAVALGSDVPACLLNTTAIGRGRGEALEPTERLTGLPALLVNPGVAVSTAAIFARWDGVDRGGLGEGHPLRIAMQSRNDLEAPAIALEPVIGEVLELLRHQQGARLVRMSGSGATCFALFANWEDCLAAGAAVRATHSEWWCAETALA